MRALLTKHKYKYRLFKLKRQFSPKEDPVGYLNAAVVVLEGFSSWSTTIPRLQLTLVIAHHSNAVHYLRMLEQIRGSLIEHGTVAYNPKYYHRERGEYVGINWLTKPLQEQGLFIGDYHGKVVQVLKSILLHLTQSDRRIPASYANRHLPALAVSYSLLLELLEEVYLN